MKQNIMYSLRLTALICIGYTLVLGFMLTVGNIFNTLGDMKNVVAIVMAVAVIAYDKVMKRR